MNTTDRDEIAEKGDEDNVEGSEDGSEESEESEALEQIDKPFEIRPWQTQTAEESRREIESFNFVNSRPLLKLQFLKKRKEFGGLPKMNDKDATDYTEIRQQSDKDPTFYNQVKVKVMEIGLQAAQETGEAVTEVHYARPVNKTVEVSPDTLLVRLDEETAASSILTSLGTTYALMEEALQYNETVDIFANDFDILPEEEIVTEGGTETTNDIKEIKSFTNSLGTDKKEKDQLPPFVSCVQFAPSIADPLYKYIVAESFVENLSFDKRVEESMKSHESFILVLDFEELHMVQPLCKLVCPVEIMCFDFHPTDPNRIIGGGINGQVFSWNMKLNLQKQTTKDKKKKKEKREDQEIPRITPEMTSAPQEPNQIPPPSSELVRKNVNSHKGAVMGIRWMPKTIRFDPKNITNPAQNTGEVTQFITISPDCQVLFWETKFPAEKDPRVYPDQYPWRANFAIQLFRPGGGGVLGGVNLIFPREAKNHWFFASSDEGELFTVDWTSKATEENQRADLVTGLWPSERAYRPCLGIDRSLFDDIVLTLYDFYFAIWKQDIEVPIFTSMIIQGAHITCGAFSPFRPGVVIIGRSDGYLDVWDFIDQSHKYIIHHNVASQGLSSIRFHETLPNILGVGDMNGNLHILELPKSLCKKIGTEEQTVNEFWRREVERVKYVDRRWNARGDQAKKQKAEEEKQALIAETTVKKETKRDENELSDDEKEEQEYQKFVQEYIEEQIEGKVKEVKDPKAVPKK